MGKTARSLILAAAVVSCAFAGRAQEAPDGAEAANPAQDDRAIVGNGQSLGGAGIGTGGRETLSASAGPSASAGTAFVPATAAATEDPAAIKGCVHICGAAFWRAAVGVRVNRSELGKCPGEGPDKMLHGGGTQNWPAVCQAALYMSTYDPSWYDLYFTIQESKEVGLGGTEMFSPIYSGAQIAAVMAVMERSRQRDPQLSQRAANWLKAVFALSSLVALPTAVKVGYVHWGGAQPDRVAGRARTGLSVGMAGNRTTIVDWGIISTIDGSLTMALDWRPRKENKPEFEDASPSDWLLFMANNGTSNINYNASIAPQFAGLTASERAALALFPVGSGNPGTAVSMASGYRAGCPITFLRTTEGVASWLGTSTEEGHACNGNKPAFFAMTLSPSGEAHILRPVIRTVHSPKGRSWRDGNRICAEGEGRKDCITLPGGTVLYEVSFTKDGPRLIAGAGGTTDTAGTGGTVDAGGGTAGGEGSAAATRSFGERERPRY